MGGRASLSQIILCQPNHVKRPLDHQLVLLFHSGLEIFFSLALVEPSPALGASRPCLGAPKFAQGLPWVNRAPDQVHRRSPSVNRILPGLLRYLFFFFFFSRKLFRRVFYPSIDQAKPLVNQRLSVGVQSSNQLLWPIGASSLALGVPRTCRQNSFFYIKGARLKAKQDGTLRELKTHLELIIKPCKHSQIHLLITL